MDKLVIKTATEGDFFKRGKQLAALADAGKALPEEHTITFEDPIPAKCCIAPEIPQAI